jgi:hypothetical protein
MVPAWWRPSRGCPFPSRLAASGHSRPGRALTEVSAATLPDVPLPGLAIGEIAGAAGVIVGAALAPVTGTLRVRVTRIRTQPGLAWLPTTRLPAAGRPVPCG